MGAAAAGKPSLIRSIQRDLASKQRSAHEITQSYLDTLHKLEPQLHSFVTSNDEQALEQAASVDRAITAGEQLPLLAGVPISIKVSFSQCHLLAPLVQLLLLAKASRKLWGCMETYKMSFDRIQS